MINENDFLRNIYRFAPPGNFLSPIPSINEIERDKEYIWRDSSQKLPGLDLNVDGQLKLFEEFKEYYKELPFQPNKTENLRFYFEQLSYTYSDAIFL